MGASRDKTIGITDKLESDQLFESCRLPYLSFLRVEAEYHFGPDAAEYRPWR